MGTPRTRSGLGRSTYAPAVLGDGEIHVVARHADGTVTEVTPTSPGPVRLGPLVVDVAEAPEGLAWSVANDSAAPVTLDAVGLRWREVRGDGTPRCFLNGYQSWSPSGVRTLGIDEDPSRHPGTFPILRSAYHADPGICSPGELRSEQVAVLGAGSGRTTCVGFVGGARHEGTVRLHLDGDRHVGVEAQAWLGGTVVPPGGLRPLHPVVRRSGDDPADLLAWWAGRAGRAEAARTSGPYQVGWCSWYHYFHAVREEDLRHNLAIADRWPFAVFQLDDGYQSAIGDWLRASDRFPSGVDGAATAIAEAGMTPGLWLAPFLAAPASDVARRHPEWFARDARTGSPLMSMFHPEWGGEMWQLDVTRPEVLAHLRDTASALRSMGYRYLKLDFTFSSSAPGVYADREQTPAQRVRAGYEAIRAGLGDDGYLLACGCPLGSVVGVVDAMRIGPDVAPSWDADPASGLPGYEAAAPSTRGAWVATLARSFMHRRLWANDPDCVMLRTSRTALSPAAARAWALAVGCSGGLALVSDDLALLDAPARRLLDEVVALGAAADAAAIAGTPPRCDDSLRPGGPTHLASAGRILSILDLDHPEASLV